jgi:hypothetical protein
VLLSERSLAMLDHVLKLKASREFCSERLVCTGKVKCTLVQVLRLYTGRTAHRGSRGIALPFLDHGTRRGEGPSVTPRPPFTPTKDPIPIVQEAGGPQGRSGQVRKISPPPGFDPRTVQPVASRYTDYATRPTSGKYIRLAKLSQLFDTNGTRSDHDTPIWCKLIVSGNANVPFQH